MTRFAFTGAVLALITVLAIRPAAQDAGRFSVSTNLVLLNVLVTDHRGAPVMGLERDAFTIFEDDRPQPIHAFTAEDAPVTAGLIVDSSISMWQMRTQLVEGAVAFAASSAPHDEMFALAFNEEVRSAARPDAPFLNDPVAFGVLLNDIIQPRGRTALFDAITAGLDYAKRGTHQRKVLVVISDGGDNASSRTLDDVIRAVNVSNVVVYAVAIVDPVDRSARPDVLRQLARASGGEVFRPKNSRQIDAALEDIARDVRQTYTLAFAPATPDDGRYHRLRVTVDAPGRGRLTARTRAGYVAAPSEVRNGTS